jgi:hypothetical protein
LRFSALEVFKSGETVMLPAAEVARLRGLGFLVDPRKVATEENLKKLQRNEQEPPPAAA